MSKAKILEADTLRELERENSFLEDIEIEEDIAKAEVAKANAFLKKVRKRKRDTKKDIKELEEIVEKLA